MKQVCEACWSEVDELLEDADGNAVCEDCLVEDMMEAEEEWEADPTS